MVRTEDRRMPRVLLALTLLCGLAAFPAQASHIVTCSGIAPEQPTCEVTFTAEYRISGQGVTQGGIFASLDGIATSGAKVAIVTCLPTTCVSSGASFAAGDVISMRVTAAGAGYYQYRLRYNHN